MTRGEIREKSMGHKSCSARDGGGAPSIRKLIEHLRKLKVNGSRGWKRIINGLEGDALIQREGKRNARTRTFTTVMPTIVCPSIVVMSAFLSSLYYTPSPLLRSPRFVTRKNAEAFDVASLLIYRTTRVYTYASRVLLAASFIFFSDRRDDFTNNVNADATV